MSTITKEGGPPPSTPKDAGPGEPCRCCNEGHGLTIMQLMTYQDWTCPKCGHDYDMRRDAL